MKEALTTMKEAPIVIRESLIALKGGVITSLAKAFIEPLLQGHVFVAMFLALRSILDMAWLSCLSFKPHLPIPSLQAKICSARGLHQQRDLPSSLSAFSETSAP